MDKFIKHRTNPQNICPQCGNHNTGASMDEDASPVAGDISICFYCGYVSVFNEDLSLRAITTDEKQALPADVLERINKLQEARVSFFAGLN